MDFSQPRSLVLGGGAARGFVFLGIYKRLAEHDLWPTDIVGNSMGSVIGACMALKIPVDEIRSVADSLHRKKMTDLNFRFGLFGGKKIYRILSKIFGITDISSTTIPLRIIAADINSCEKVVFDKGRLVDCIRASISIPNVFAPYSYQGRLLVDGGMLTNLPVDNAQQDQVLALSSLAPLDEPIAFTKMTKSKKRIKKKGFLGINGQIFTKAFTCAMTINETRSLETSHKAITLLRPEFRHIARHHFHKIDDMIDIGYAAAQEALAQYL